MYYMRKLFTCFLFTLATICAYAQSVDLNTGIKNGAAYFEQNLERGSIIAVIIIRSDSPPLSEYVIDELSSHLVNGRIFTVVDRNYMDAIQREMNYQLSGEVSDETAQSIGKRIGAQIVITGSVQLFGNEYRLDLRALSVETGVIQGVLRQDITNDNRIRTLTGVSLAANAAQGREPRSTAPRAGGSKFLINAGAGSGFVFGGDAQIFLISAGIDYLFPVGISLGGYFTYVTYEDEYSYESTYYSYYSKTDGTMIASGVRMAWNFNPSQYVIPYMGLRFGYNWGDEYYERKTIASSSGTTSSSHSYDLSSLSVGADSGIRFFFNNYIGVYIEAAYNVGVFIDYHFLMGSLGLALKY
jgi:TolB-like protein